MYTSETNDNDKNININLGEHYKTITITKNMVGEKLDPALIAVLYNIDPLLLQALKKLLLSGQRGLKNRKDDLMGVISAVKRQLEIDNILKQKDNDNIISNVIDEKEKSKPFESEPKKSIFL